MAEMLKQNTPLLLALIQDTVAQVPGRMEIAHDSDQERQLNEELNQVIDDLRISREAVDTLFPEGIPTDLRFYDHLNGLVARIGWRDHTEQAIGVIWETAIELLSISDREKLLNSLPLVQGHDFYIHLRSLPRLLAKIELRPDFAAEWLPALVRRIGNDLASGAFWDSLGVISEKFVRATVATVRSLYGKQEESEIAVAAYLIGTARVLTMDEALSIEFSEIQTEFAKSENRRMRSVYRRSWVQTARRDKISLPDLNALLEQFQLRTSEEQHEAFWIVCESLLVTSLPHECFDAGLAWLRANASPAISPEAKYNVVDFVTRLADSGRVDVLDLILSVQPIPTENKGTWQRIEHLLVTLQKGELGIFTSFFSQLAERNARGLLKVMQEPRSFEWLFAALRDKDLGMIVGRLSLDPDACCRKIGLFLFDKLGLATLPDTLFDDFSESSTRLAFHELQRTHLHGGAIARFLICLIPHVQHACQDFQNDFFDEIVLQSKNYSGLCLEEFERRADDFPLLRRAVDKANDYFESLRQLKKSGICAMDVPGYRQAIQTHARRFSNQVAKGAEELSVFARLCKKYRLLYGKSWRIYVEGKIGDASGLQELSHTVEIPRIELIDPERMAMRRVYATTQIAALSRTVEMEDEE
jgi:hypothetical protein